MKPTPKESSPKSSSHLVGLDSLTHKHRKDTYSNAQHTHIYKLQKLQQNKHKQQHHQQCNVGGTRKCLSVYDLIGDHCPVRFTWPTFSLSLSRLRSRIGHTIHTFCNEKQSIGCNDTGLLF